MSKVLKTIVILSFPLMLLLSSCCEIDVPIENATYETVNVKCSNGVNRMFSVSKFEYRNHNYIRFEESYIHDPDCPCLKSKEKNTLSIEY